MGFPLFMAARRGEAERALAACAVLHATRGKGREIYVCVKQFVVLGGVDVAER